MNVFLILFALLLLFQKFQQSLQFLVQKTVKYDFMSKFQPFLQSYLPFSNANLHRKFDFLVVRYLVDKFLQILYYVYFGHNATD